MPQSSALTGFRRRRFHDLQNGRRDNGLSGQADATGTLAAALAHAGRLLQASPAKAAEQAREILRVMPNQPDATYLLGAALAEMGDTEAAVDAFRRVTRAVPRRPQAWRALGDALSLMDDTAGAEAAYARHIQASVNDPQLLEAASALCDGKLAVAERRLREFLKENPTDVAAIRMLAECGARLARYEDAEKLLARCLALAPGFDMARHNYATVLFRQSKAEEAVTQLDILLKRDARNAGARSLKAASLVQIGEYAQSIAIYEKLLREYPTQPKAWMSYGHALKTVGRADEGIAAYRKAIALLPSLGESYWSLANLKTFRFTEGDVAAMRAQLARGDLEDEDRMHFHFALGKALEDAGSYEESFAQYEMGNASRKTFVPYDSDDIEDQVRRAKALFTPEFFRARAGHGDPAPDPIFIVGLPRAGSTLLEQILASHSQVEGTMELPNIVAIARRLGGRIKPNEDTAYPEALAGLDAEAAAALGAEYLARTRIQRKLGRPFFIDKLPNNWLHTGLINLILPNAKIVDARRHPLACCFSNFKQHFARGQRFTYSLADIGRYYADYVELMAHMDRVLPGRVHRVLYEDMVADPGTEVRRLLDACGLPFEDACLRFYENERAVRTASSEQVRQPIFREGLDQWRNFEPWLGPLKAALGAVLDAYPAVPEFPAAARSA